MFVIERRPTCSWSHTSWGRGKRTEPTKLGFYVIEHIATGKIITGWSNDVSDTVDKNIRLLLEKRHPNRMMNILVGMDMDLRLHEYMAASASDAKACIKVIQKSTVPDYLLLD